MRIMKLNEWKCGMDIDDVGAYPEGVFGDMIDHFGLRYNPHTESYDCDGDVNLREYYNNLNANEQREFDDSFVKDGRMTIRFGMVKGHFILPGGFNTPYILTSLEGSPESVGGSFSCSDNRLTSLEGCPESVGGNFDCSCNDLTSLEGSPESVGGNFYCYKNQLTSLEGCTKTVGGWLDCSNNKTKFTKKDVAAVCDAKIYV